jgi:hypothetical protein
MAVANNTEQWLSMYRRWRRSLVLEVLRDGMPLHEVEAVAGEVGARLSARAQAGTLVSLDVPMPAATAREQLRSLFHDQRRVVERRAQRGWFVGHGSKKRFAAPDDARFGMEYPVTLPPDMESLVRIRGIAGSLAPTERHLMSQADRPPVPKPHPMLPKTRLDPAVWNRVEDALHDAECGQGVGVSVYLGHLFARRQPDDLAKEHGLTSTRVRSLIRDVHLELRGERSSRCQSYPGESHVSDQDLDDFVLGTMTPERQVQLRVQVQRCEGCAERLRREAVAEARIVQVAARRYSEPTHHCFGLPTTPSDLSSVSTSPLDAYPLPIYQPDAPISQSTRTVRVAMVIAASVLFMLAPRLADQLLFTDAAPTEVSMASPGASTGLSSSLAATKTVHGQRIAEPRVAM